MPPLELLEDLGKAKPTIGQTSPPAGWTTPRKCEKTIFTAIATNVSYECCYKAVKSNVVSCSTFGQNSGRVKATRCCTVAIASVFLFFSVSFSRDNGAYEYGTTQMWPGTIIIQDTLFSFHFYYYGL